MSLHYVSTQLKKSLRIDSVVSIHYFEYASDFHYPGETHDFWELVYCDRGELLLSVDDRMVILNRGEAFLHPPKQFHNIGVCDNKAANSVIVSFYSDSDELFVLSDNVIPTDTYVTDALFSVLREAKASFQNQLGQVYDAQLRRKETSDFFASEQVIQNYLELLLIHLIRKNLQNLFPSLPEEKKKNPLLGAITAYMRGHLGERLTLSVLASRFSISPTTLKSLFRRHFGMGAMEYLTDLRMERAKELLRNGDISCTEIANRCGFCSVHHFSSAFKHRYGMSPLAYTKSIKSMLESPEE